MASDGQNSEPISVGPIHATCPANSYVFNGMHREKCIFLYWLLTLKYYILS